MKLPRYTPLPLSCLAVASGTVPGFFWCWPLTLDQASKLLCSTAQDPGQGQGSLPTWLIPWLTVQPPLPHPTRGPQYLLIGEPAQDPKIPWLNALAGPVSAASAPDVCLKKNSKEMVFPADKMISLAQR